MQAMQEYFVKGGIFMYPIVLFSLWALTLIIERTIFYCQVASRTTKMRLRFFKTLEEEGMSSASSFLSGQRGVLRSVLGAALDNSSLPMDKIKKKIDNTLLEQLPPLSRFLNLIAVFATLMPMLGLLGTVTGMIATFKVIALQGTGDAQAMADGIAEALITTQAGLIAAVPIILGHTILSNRLHKIITVVKESTARILDYLEDTRKRP